MKNLNWILLTLTIVLVACTPAASTLTSEPVPVTDTVVLTQTFTAPAPTQTFTPLPPTETSTPSPIPYVDELNATVSADLLSCRYGPGALYLYLFAFKKGANIQITGRADGNDWVLVENGQQDCWIHTKFVDVQGDPQTLKSIYPDEYKLPVSPYYGPSTVLSATREGEKITVTWIEILVSPGKYENENMFPYLIEVWRCENGEYIFDTLGARYPVITFTDQTGCDNPSHGRVFVQEKHGYAGPAEIPWPAYITP
jgi:hypothetical protein